MPIFPYKLKKVTEGLYIKQSNHFFYTDFGVRPKKEMRYSGNRYINTGTPGTGFFERGSESHSYHKFVRAYLAQQQKSYWRMLMRREPSFDRELIRAKAAMNLGEGALKQQILDCYINALSIGRTAENNERIIRGIKDKIGHRSNKFLVSVLSHYKNKVSQLEHDMKSVQLDVRQTCTEEQYEAYVEMVEAFVGVADCRRIWHGSEARRGKVSQVFFDLGVFDYINAETYLPIMRTSNRVDYYILPTHILVVRSTVDFDVVPIREVNIVWQEMAIQESVEALNAKIGDAASMVRIPAFDETWYMNHVRPVVRFVKAYEKLRDVQ